MQLSGLRGCCICPCCVCGCVSLSLFDSRGSTVNTWPRARATNTLHRYAGTRAKTCSIPPGVNHQPEDGSKALRYSHSHWKYTESLHEAKRTHPEGCAAMASGAPAPCSHSSRPKLVLACCSGSSIDRSHLPCSILDLEFIKDPSCHIADASKLLLLQAVATNTWVGLLHYPRYERTPLNTYFILLFYEFLDTECCFTRKVSG